MTRRRKLSLFLLLLVDEVISTTPPSLSPPKTTSPTLLPRDIVPGDAAIVDGNVPSDPLFDPRLGFTTFPIRLFTSTTPTATPAPTPPDSGGDGSEDREPDRDADVILPNGDILPVNLGGGSGNPLPAGNEKNMPDGGAGIGTSSSTNVIPAMETPRIGEKTATQVLEGTSTVGATGVSGSMASESARYMNFGGKKVLFVEGAHTVSAVANGETGAESGARRSMEVRWGGIGMVTVMGLGIWNVF